jgi:hypothetical protein
VKPLFFCILCASSCALDEQGREPDRAKSLKKRQIADNSWRSPILAYHLLLFPRGFVSLEVGMRGFTVGLVVVMFSALALGQVGTRGIPGCQNTCGPYIPLITTPSVAFETVSSSPVGASNATGGLQAGARNSTLSLIPGNTDAVHTQVVWYSGGGSPLVSPAVRLPHPEPMAIHDEHMMHMMQMEHEQGEQARANWTYYAGPGPSGSPVEASAAAKSGKHAARTYTNDDVDRVAAKSEQFRKK